MHFKKGIACVLAACLTLPLSVFAENEQASVTTAQNKNQIQITGNAPQTGIAVSVQVLTPDGGETITPENIVYHNQTTAGENGTYFFQFVMPAALSSGAYPVKITYEDGTGKTLSLDYKNTNDISKAFTELSAVTTADGLLDALNQYGTAWNFNFSLFEKLSAADQKSAAEKFIALNGCKAESPEKAAEIFDSAVIAQAASGFDKNAYSELITGAYKAYTGFAETLAYQKFSNRLDGAALNTIAEKMTASDFSSAQDAKNAFEIYIGLHIAENTQTWYDMKEILETLSAPLGIDGTAFSASKNPEEIAGALMGKTFTPDEFRAAYNAALDAAQKGIQIIFQDAASETPWANDSINALYAAGIVSGVGGNLFEPNGNVSREQFAKMIVSMLGDVEYVAENPFSDVAANEWYAPFVCTAKAIGIVSGTSETTFGVSENITREQMAAMIYRAGNLLGYAPAGTPKTFTDESAISDYAKEAIASLTAGGVIGGMPDGSFQPNATATRAEAACMIYNMMRAVQHNADLKTGLEPLTGVDSMVSLQENYNSLAEKDYKERDLTSFHGWYFVPNGASYISAAPAPSGKSYAIPMTAAQKAKNAKDIAMRLSANNSDKSAFFDTHPFLMSYKTKDKFRIEMNLYLHSESTSSDYKVFDTLFMTETDNENRQEMPFFYFAGDAGIYYYDNNLNGVRCGSYTPDKWIHVTAEMDAGKKTYALFLDGTKLVENIPFNNADILWDGSSIKSGFQKIRLRTGVVPDSAGTSYAYLDDFLWARYTDSPMILLRDKQISGNEIALIVPENIQVSSLSENISLLENGTAVPFEGTYANGVYSLKLTNPLTPGSQYTIQIGRWVSTQDGISFKEPSAITFIAK